MTTYDEGCTRTGIQWTIKSDYMLERNKTGISSTEIFYLLVDDLKMASSSDIGLIRSIIMSMDKIRA